MNSAPGIAQAEGHCVPPTGTAPPPQPAPRPIVDVELRDTTEGDGPPADRSSRQTLTSSRQVPPRKRRTEQQAGLPLTAKYPEQRSH
eukprot:CAMPEP_0113536906 /NCGR_PEP_ID=MMETSP0015_2-20120614/6533_1 /TAXON_ID=2838 /ORGANISM="Odontella" /LENGTH=86 /DNA_ID=CAMNT_0000436347 /DNA_START=270 /DNA_END=531 /DNA_ORIENTATION=- /assembly_acc=CAM_ASM_000160